MPIPMAMARFKNIPASAASTLVEGYCGDFIQLAASLAQTLEQVSMRNLPLGSSRNSLKRVEQGMRELSDAIAILLKSTDGPGGTPKGQVDPAPRPTGDLGGAPLPGGATLPPRPAAQAEVGDCTIQGSTGSMPLTTVFQFLSRMRKTGTLQVTIRDEQLSFEVVNGCVDSTRSSRPPAGERIGELLVEQGLVNKRNVELLVEDQTETAGYLGMELVRSRLITKKQLHEALEKQARMRIRRAVKSRAANYAFTEGRTPIKDGHIALQLALQPAPRKR